MEEWEKISKEISKIIARSTNGGKLTPEIIKANPHLSQLMINRARILKNAANKAELAIKILKENFKPGQKWIVYCDNQTQLKEIRQRAEDADLDAYEYYAEMDGDRTETLRYFERHGGVLVSIKCLDEGVDIPSTTHALILASSKNPREFIQRRGRVLRLSPGKPFAHLYDAITLPMGELSEEEHRADSIVLGELSRAIQFGTWAENPSCITDLKIVANFKSLPLWRYDLQGAVYQAGVEAVTGERLPFYLATATKERVVDLDVFQIPQTTLNLAMDEIGFSIEHYAEVKAGLVPPKACGHCDYCKSVKQAAIRNYNELLGV